MSRQPSTIPYRPHDPRRGAALHPALQRQVGRRQARRRRDRRGARPRARAGRAAADERRRALRARPWRRAAGRRADEEDGQGARIQGRPAGSPTRRRCEIVRMVLVGEVNRDLVATINRETLDDPVAVGVAGEDGGLLTTVPRDRGARLRRRRRPCPRRAAARPARPGPGAGRLDDRRRPLGPALQYQRRRGGDGDRGGDGGGEDRLSHRRAGPARGRRRTRPRSSRA